MVRHGSLVMVIQRVRRLLLLLCVKGYVRGVGMRAERTYALDGRILGVELPTSGHGCDVRAQ